MKLFTPRIIAFWVGFLSLSQEILWTRVVSFSYLTKPQAFALVLALYLLGIAMGAALGRVACRHSRDVLATGGVILIIAGVVDIAALVLYGSAANGAFSLPTLSIAIITTAALKSALFPLVHHLGSDDVVSGKGVSFSRVYVSNVFGSSLGPLAGGLVLLQLATLQESFIAISALTTALGCFALWQASKNRDAAIGGALCALIAIGLAAPNMLVPALAAGKEGGREIVTLIENRNGIVHTVDGGSDGDIVFGNNVYDGRISTDILKNKNGIHRAYALAEMHDQARDVLIIGLSGGAWTKVVSNFPTVERIDVVEINPAYLELIAKYPEVSSILEDPRIRFHIDDGRRWLRLNPDKRYDLIVLNSIHHWRANATNLLSAEFMELVRDHLEWQGIFYVNSTSSPDVLFTASEVFKHAYRYDNFVAASGVDFLERMSLNKSRTSEIFGPGSPGVNAGEQGRLLEKIYSIPFLTVHDVRRESSRDFEIVRDDNMITEYKFGAGFF
ncbi:spermidine synthase [Luteimonas granuli]|uniref:PABS domain-containing protein n=1 Tax=Luteimonas granuli TaxID=1176533 RepID=A0A518N5G5_9GAMM|nr:hypothetical protein [Luteimonas granuli]QDW67156.1 hypothetical protein FPZ22_09885 [Luteimonas granuli]